MSRILVDSGIEWIGKYPEDWDLLPLRRVVNNINEKNNPIKFTNILSLTNTLGVLPYEEKGSQGNISKEDITQYKIAYKDTVIINSMNLKIGSVGYSKYDGCVSPVYYVLKSNDKSDMNFINYLFQSNFQKYLGKYGKGILEIREKISMYDVLHSYIPIPSVKEQKKIADYLDEQCLKINEIIKDNNKEIELLEEYKMSIIENECYKCSIDYTLSLSRNCELITNDWTIAKLKEIVNYQGGYAYNSAKFSVNGDNQVLRLGNVKNDNLLLTANPVFITKEYAEQSPNCKVIENDILFTMTGTKGKKDYFYTTIATKNDEEKNMYINQRVGIFRKKENVKINMKYYNYLFKTNKIRDYIFLSETGTANQGNLGIDSLNEIIVPVPPLSEQNRIVNFLDEIITGINKVIEYRKQIIEKLEEYKKSLIYECVTGKREV